jgi:hypothetical protein
MLSLCRNTQNICKTQSALQKGFTRGESPTIAALIVTELFTEAIENNKSIFIALTDAQKAFDIHGNIKFTSIVSTVISFCPPYLRCSLVTFESSGAFPFLKENIYFKTSCNG